MEDEECDRRRSQSFDSFSNDHTFSGTSRESSMAPHHNRLVRDDLRNSLPRSRKQNIPSISLQFSAHAESSWNDYNRECSSSLSSVEEATEEQLTKQNFSPARRKSNN